VSTTWQTYEEVAAYLLNQFASEFSLERVEGKQKIKGNRSGTDWAIDAKGVRSGGEAFVIVECRRYKNKRQDQERLAGLAYRIIDAGAEGGIVVSHLGLQAGATKVAEAEGIISVRLDKDSTATEFSMQFLNKIFVGIHERASVSDFCDAEVTCTCDSCNQQFRRLQNEIICQACQNLLQIT
jgi:Zn finger protein HypA/HybF involved in hydrogenase expression